MPLCGFMGTCLCLCMCMSSTSSNACKVFGEKKAPCIDNLLFQGAMSGSAEKKQVTRIWRIKLERHNNLSFDTNKSSFLLHSMSPNLWHCILPLVCLIVCSHTQSHQANSCKSPYLRQYQPLFFYHRERHR